MDNIGVFPFREPANAPGVGFLAADILVDELQRTGLCHKVRRIDETWSRDEKQRFQLIKNDRFRYVISGEVEYYFEGLNLQPSRLQEKFNVYRINGEHFVFIGEFRVQACGAPSSPMDFIIYQYPGSGPAQMKELFQKIARKFSNIINREKMNAHRFKGRTQNRFRPLYGHNREKSEKFSR